MKRWQITGFIATVIIILSIPLYVFRVTVSDRPDPAPGKAQLATFVGRDKCVTCHEQEAKKWQGSDHDKAMDVADSKTVLGDFDSAVFENNGTVSSFFRKGEAFYVNTQGPDGKTADFKISYVFGHYPLQQYLVPFKNGRLQALPIAWDADKQTWYHLNPDEKIASTEWMHWTQQSHNWNGMCAECHSTNLKKQYDPKSDTYQTVWSEIDVSCEACHGPGSLHVKWADLPEMARPETKNTDLVVKTSGLNPEQQIAICARCHSRRVQLGNIDHSKKEILDSIIPELLVDSLYHADGQILDEVYVYGSFVQSKMYHNNVKCSDCHDVHSGKTVLKGNDLCLQCHRAEVFDAKSHHFHQKTGEEGEPLKDKSGRIIAAVGQGAECVKCHMPGQMYMGVDYRPDHSLRIPRPDLSIPLGTPNACNQCHLNETRQWSTDYFTKWYGLSRKPHYGTTLAAGRAGRPEARKELLKLAEDSLIPDIVRASALQLLGAYSDEASRQAFDRALANEEALIRYAAVRNFNRSDPDQRLKMLTPLLVDPVKAVRMEAAMGLAMGLAMVPQDRLSVAEKKAFEDALAEYEKAMEYSADFTFSGLNLGNLYYYLGKPERSLEQYKRAIKIADEFNPAKMNLAVLLSGQGKNREAEKLLREVIAVEPDAYEAYYKLGLLLVESKKSSEAVVYLERAARGFATRARVYYNLGLLLQSLNRHSEAERALLEAVKIDPHNPDFLYGASFFYFKTGKFLQSKRLAQKLVDQHPANAAGRRILTLVDKKLRKP
ncbi:MAG: tetratricopeptide repeat protein [Deltaproteobacteria bacterium]|nr:tetratricopeptide repeat protein [Deltaproteobacteria bacterium]